MRMPTQLQAPPVQQNRVRLHSYRGGSIMEASVKSDQSILCMHYQTGTTNRSLSEMIITNSNIGKPENIIRPQIRLPATTTLISAHSPTPAPSHSSTPVPDTFNLDLSNIDLHRGEQAGKLVVAMQKMRDAQIIRSESNDICIIDLCNQVMSQAENPRRKISKILENLSIELDRVGLTEKFEYKTTNDPWIDLENAHSNLVAIFQAICPTPQANQLKNNNQAVVLDCLRFFINIHQQLSNLSKMIYDANYSLDLYKSYRKLYEEISTASNSLYQYESEDEDFVKEKEELITQNLQICEQIQKTTIANNKERERKNNPDSDQTIIANLQKEVEVLNEMIRENDEEFTIQIQRYNNTLYDMQETIREYEVRMDKIREYEGTIDELEHKVIRLKEEKYRDDMLIDNMSKKIRFYEKERGGVDAFLSPRNNYSRKNLLSPTNRVFNQSLLGSEASGIQTKHKNYQGERLTSN